MNLKLLATLVVVALSIGLNANASVSASSGLDELDPYDPNIESILSDIDQDYMEQTGISPFLEQDYLQFVSTGCRRDTCKVWALVDRSTQTLTLYVDGNQQATWKVSTGTPGRDTPNFDKHPDGRIYDRYTSTKFPGGDYKNLGNMPYAVFISGGFAIHGTGTGNWSKLGRRASHGCIRLHPDNGYAFNRLVRQAGISNVWITVKE